MRAMEGLYRRLQRQQMALLNALENWHHRDREYRPSPETWSAAEVISHLAKSEAGATLNMRPALATHKQLVSTSDAWRARILVRWMLSPQRAVMTKAAAERIWPLQGGIWPLAETSFHEAADLWRFNRAELLRLARSAETDGRAVFAHPGSGFMDLVLMLRFIYAHTRHHKFQLDRLRKAMRNK